MDETHAILVRLDKSDLSLSDEELRTTAADLAEAQTDSYFDQAFDSRALLTEEEAKEAGLPGPVVLGRMDPEAFGALLDEWAQYSLRQAHKLLQEAAGDQPAFTITPELLRRTWNEESTCELQSWTIRRALQLAERIYRVESRFFSSPDGSPKLSDATRAAVHAQPERFALAFFHYHW